MYWAVGLFLLCAGIGTLIGIYIWLAWYSAVQGFALTGASEARKAVREGLSKSDIQKLPTFVCIHDQEEEEEEKGKDGLNTIQLQSDLECAVCLDSFGKGEKCRQMPACKHTLHVQCADQWLSKRPVCPICRTSAKVDLPSPFQSPSSRPGYPNSNYVMTVRCENPSASDCTNP